MTRSHSREWLERYRSRVRGCLVGGAVGDALGAPVEFLALEQIRQAYGPDGLTTLRTGPGAPAAVTDDTQMSLFTAEGLIRARDRVDDAAVVVYRAHLRWLQTQDQPDPPERPDGWLAGQRWLYARRAPGNACLSGLRSGQMGTPAHPQNLGSKGCGTVMRSAPFGLIPELSTVEVFDLAVACAAQTHGHPSGMLAAGAFAAIVRALLDEHDLAGAVEQALRLLAGHRDHEEVTASLRAAVAASRRPAGPRELERLGGGWVAEEALAIGVYCVLAHPEPADARAALTLSINHSGDSDSTGSISGNLIGAWHGETALPPDWVAEVEGRSTVLALADDFAAVYAQRDRLAADHPLWLARYPDH
jgi:ADP-ribosylglycohydrolase